MSIGSVIGGTLRALVIATATGAAAFGLLVVFQPFGKTPQPPAATVSGTPAATALQERIETLRAALRDTEAALDADKQGAAASGTSPDLALRTQYEAQITAAMERRDLARRHAEAIRASLDAGVTPASLAEIRDSVVIGQLLGRQATLDAQIAVEGARLRPNHPTMRALTAQRTALATQIRQEAASIAAALDAEARIDDAQIKLLEGELPALAVATPAVDSSALETKAAAQRAELDGLVDAYFNIPPATTVAPQVAEPANPLSLANLAVVGIAALAAIVFQIVLATRRRRSVELSADDVTAWENDDDPENVIDTDDAEPLRKAS